MTKWCCDGGDSRGIALVAVLLALAVLSVLGAASFFVAVQEMRSGRGAIAVEQALSEAEGTADSLVARWNPSAYNSLASGDSSVALFTAPSPSRWTRAVVIGLGGVTFLIRVESIRGEARRAVALIVRLQCDTSCLRTSTYVDSWRPAQLPERGWVWGF